MGRIGRIVFHSWPGRPWGGLDHAANSWTRARSARVSALHLGGVRLTTDLWSDGTPPVCALAERIARTARSWCVFGRPVVWRRPRRRLGSNRPGWCATGWRPGLGGQRSDCKTRPTPDSSFDYRRVKTKNSRRQFARVFGPFNQGNQSCLSLFANVGANEIGPLVGTPAQKKTQLRP